MPVRSRSLFEKTDSRRSSFRGRSFHSLSKQSTAESPAISSTDGSTGCRSRSFSSMAMGRLLQGAPGAVARSWSLRRAASRVGRSRDLPPVGEPTPRGRGRHRGGSAADGAGSRRPAPGHGDRQHVQSRAGLPWPGRTGVHQGGGEAARTCAVRDQLVATRVAASVTGNSTIVRICSGGVPGSLR